MTQTELIPVAEDTQLQTVCALANEIWHEHFTPIIGAAQVEYMLQKFQSYPAISAQIHNDSYQYFLLRFRGANAGYMGVQVKDGHLFLSKLYVAKQHRGNKIASAAVGYLTNWCRQDGLDKIWLTVNRHNHNTIAVYERLGFVTVREQKADIGNGFVMDDYIMEKTI